METTALRLKILGYVPHQESYLPFDFVDVFRVVVCIEEFNLAFDRSEGVSETEYQVYLEASQTNRVPPKH